MEPTTETKSYLEEKEEEKEGEKEGEEDGEEEEGDGDPSCFVYLLEASDRSATYVGATVNLKRRLRQHNKEIKGGAKATGKKVARGVQWNRILYVEGFPDWQAALQFEWRFKQLGRTKPAKHVKNPLQRRLVSLRHLLALPSSTTRALPFASWQSPPRIVWSQESYQHIFENIP